MSTNSPSPSRVVAVIRTGYAKRNSPHWATTRPLTWPMCSPSVDTSSVPRSSSSCTLSRRRSVRRTRAACAAVTSARSITARPSRAAWASASCSRSPRVRVWVLSLAPSSASRAAWSTRQATASRVSGRRPCSRAVAPSQRASASEDSACRGTSSSKSATTLNRSSNSGSRACSRWWSCRSPNSTILRSSGTGSGSRGRVFTQPSACGIDSMTTRADFSARFRPSQLSGSLSTFAASSISTPPLAR